jgi:anti-sigma factor RsiW
LDPCADSRFIPLLARGELEPAEEARVRAHLSSCQTCTRELAAEENLTKRLREGISRPAAPADLRAAVEEEMRAHRTVPRRARITRRMLFAASAAALLILAAFLAYRRMSPQDPLVVATRHAAATYQAMDRQRDLLQRETAEARTRLLELAQRYGLPATTAFQGDEEVRLVSVRQGLALGKVSALLVYIDSKGRLVTLEILPGGDLKVPRERTRAVQQFHPMLTRAEQLGVALWRQGPAFYLLTAPMDEAELAQLYLKVRTHTS